ncbi:MAG: DUF4428 domain-containing protein [Oscillospiraceae bacterium]|nr:DUF4428 domain-containing protein [Oscillospiraceae bacterium]
MGLFDKKKCDICGGKIGLLGNRKLDDGNMCADCAKKLSPFTTDRRKTSINEIKAHLEYREANKAELAALNVTKSVGDCYMVHIDEEAGKFVVSSSNKWQQENPDVISFSQVTKCVGTKDEHRTELMQKDKDGKLVSYRPRQYKYEYDFYVTLSIDSPFFDEIRFKVNMYMVDGESKEYGRIDAIQDEVLDVFFKAQVR